MAGVTKGTAIAIGAGTLAASVLVGKIVVDKTLNSPGWEAKQETSPGARSFDDSLRFVATVLMLATMVVKLPETWESGKKLAAELEGQV